MVSMWVMDEMPHRLPFVTVVTDLPLPVGSLVSIRSRAGVEHAVTYGEVVGFTREVPRASAAYGG